MAEVPGNISSTWPGYVNSLLLKMTIEIVDFPIENGDFLVCLPEGKCEFRKVRVMPKAVWWTTSAWFPLPNIIRGKAGKSGSMKPHCPHQPLPTPEHVAKQRQSSSNNKISAPSEGMCQDFRAPTKEWLTIWPSWETRTNYVWHVFGAWV